MVRDKIIHKVNYLKINERNIILYILSSAGTYIKEFIHGDFGRTVPNLSILMQNEADIFQLDVI